LRSNVVGGGVVSKRCQAAAAAVVIVEHQQSASQQQQSGWRQAAWLAPGGRCDELLTGWLAVLSRKPPMIL